MRDQQAQARKAAEAESAKLRDQEKARDRALACVVPLFLRRTCAWVCVCVCVWVCVCVCVCVCVRCTESYHEADKLV